MFECCQLSLTNIVLFWIIVKASHKSWTIGYWWRFAIDYGSQYLRRTGLKKMSRNFFNEPRSVGGDNTRDGIQRSLYRHQAGHLSHGWFNVHPSSLHGRYFYGSKRRNWDTYATDAHMYWSIRIADLWVLIPSQMTCPLRHLRATTKVKQADSAAI